jgi:formylglycine-generating enzyme required for sulfatase activity
MRAAALLLVAACGYPQPQRIGGDAGHDAPKKDAPPDSPPPFGSCVGLASTCGPSGTASCCGASSLPGGTVYRGYDMAGDSLSGTMADPATVGAFKLDTYEVTVGRFRTFINAMQGTQVHPPAAGTGAHAAIASSGWDSTWDSNLPATQAALLALLKCGNGQTWTDSPAANESLPINCVSWYEAMAFCIWDGGYLPTEAEWSYAASGGADGRTYPWSNPAAATNIDCSHANYTDTGIGCAPTGPIRVGTDSPAGDGKFGHADLAGNVAEWTLDSDGNYPTPCADCANLSDITMRMIRGGYFGSPGGAPDVRVVARNALTSSSHFFVAGMRCARPM